MARRIVNRKEKRAEYDAYERRQDDDEVEETKEEKEGDDDDEEADDDEEEAAEGEGEKKLEDEQDEEEAPKPKKKKVVKEPKPKAKAKPRTRAPKAVPRMKVVWGVFNNSNQRVATFDYPKRREADDHAAKLHADKHQTFFVQPVKEPIEEKKEK